MPALTWISITGDSVLSCFTLQQCSPLKESEAAKPNSRTHTRWEDWKGENSAMIKRLGVTCFSRLFLSYGCSGHHTAISADPGFILLFISGSHGHAVVGKWYRALVDSRHNQRATAGLEGSGLVFVSVSVCVVWKVGAGRRGGGGAVRVCVRVCVHSDDIQNLVKYRT